MTLNSVSDLSFTFIDKVLEEKTEPPTGENHNSAGINESKENSEPSLVSANIRASDEVSDNRGSQSPGTPHDHTLSLQQEMASSGQQTTSETFVSTPEDPWHLTYTELKLMRARIGTLEKVEAATLDFAQQLQAITDRTANVEASTSQNSHKITELEEEIKDLRKTVDSQKKELQSLHKIKEDFTKTSHKSISEMNSLLEQQRKQVESLRTIRKDIQTDAQKQKEELQAFKTSYQDSQKDIQEQFKQVADDAEHKALKEQAFRKCQNIVIIGLPEHKVHSAYSVAMRFFKTQLNLRRLEVEAAYRMGRVPSEGNNYIRPLLVKFTKLPHRNLVWKRRFDIQQSEGQQQIKIQADIPKALRDNVTILYRVLKAASAMEEFRSAIIKDYTLILHGKLSNFSMKVS